MSDSNKDTFWGNDEKLCYNEYSGNWGLNTLVKGKSIFLLLVTTRLQAEA